MNFLDFAKYMAAKMKREYLLGLTEKGNAPKHLTQRYLIAVELDLLILMFENPHNREDIKKELAKIEKEIKDEPSN